MKFPPHFSFAELTHSDYAVRHDIDNLPNEEETGNLIKLAWFLESLRQQITMWTGKRAPIYINSGFRCPELNLAIGGSKTSAHMQGLAADIRSPILTPLELAEFIRDHFEEDGYDQVIHEFGRWVHLGLSNGLQRNQQLTATKENGRTVYKKGLS